MYGRKSFRYYGVHVWNYIPSQIKCAPTLNSFKDLISHGQVHRAPEFFAKLLNVLTCILKCLMTLIILICIYPLLHVEK